MRHANIAIFVPHVGCPNTCSFCNQRTISGEQAAPAPEQVACVCEQALADMGERAKTAQIAFFGGSFTAMERDYMKALLQAVQPYIGQGKFAGIRISTRPDAIDEEILSLLGQHRVIAIELGAQSMDDTVLAQNKRGHTAAQVNLAAELIKRRGFELGLQMMTGLYSDTDERAMETARRLATLAPDTIRIYPTVVLKGSLLEALYRQGAYTPQTLEEAVALCAELIPFFERQGIAVIRAGLHASELLGEQAVAGAYHPAFRELCESRVYLNAILAQITRLGGHAFAVTVGRRYISRAIGHGKSNLNALRERGFYVTINVSDELEKYQLSVNRHNQRT